MRDYNIRTAAAVVLFDTSTRCTYSSLKPLVPGAAYTWYLVRYMQAPNRLYKSEVRGSLSRVKTPCEQGLPHYTYVLQAEQRLPHATEEKANHSFLMERGSIAKHHRAWNPQCTQRFRAEEFPLLCPIPKVMPHFSLGHVGEAPCLLSHRWIDSSPIFCKMGHTIASIKAAWRRSLR